MNYVVMNITVYGSKVRSMTSLDIGSDHNLVLCIFIIALEDTAL